MITVVINANENMRNLNVPDDCSIRGLMQECIAKAVLPNSMTIDEFYLVHNGVSLKYDDNQTVQTYSIESTSMLSVCMRVVGGSSRRLKSLRGEVSRTKEPCSISLDDNPNEWRAKMNCGHVISVDSMLQYITSALDNGDSTFHCALCRSQWKYNVIRHVISSSKSEAELFSLDDQMNENGLKNEAEIKRCPQCESMCQRSDWETSRVGTSNRVTCVMCLKKTEITTSTSNKIFDFCWSCGKMWSDMSSTKSCGNEGCDGLTRLARRNKDLQKCGVKSIQGTPECPTMRACVICNFLIHHNDNCKHVKCSRCGTDFCFVCLLPAVNGMWQCGACDVAPRQVLESDRKQAPKISGVGAAQSYRQQVDRMRFDDFDAALRGQLFRIREVDGRNGRPELGVFDELMGAAAGQPPGARRVAAAADQRRRERRDPARLVLPENADVYR